MKHLLLRFDDCWYSKTAKWFVSYTTEINNTQTSAYWYLWQTYYWLCIAFRKRRSIFWVLSTSTHLFYQHETIFEGYFWIVTNTSRYIFETYQRRHRINIFFEICFRRPRDVTWKTPLLRCLWDVLKRSQKRHLFCDVLETS